MPAYDHREDTVRSAGSPHADPKPAAATAASRTPSASPPPQATAGKRSDGTTIASSPLNATFVAASRSGSIIVACQVRVHRAWAWGRAGSKAASPSARILRSCADRGAVPASARNRVAWLASHRISARNARTWIEATRMSRSPPTAWELAHIISPMKSRKQCRNESRDLMTKVCQRGSDQGRQQAQDQIGRIADEQSPKGCAESQEMKRRYDRYRVSQRHEFDLSIDVPDSCQPFPACAS